MCKNSWMFVIVSLLVVFSLNVDAQEQVYHEGWLAGCGTDATLYTTCTHRLDITVNQPMVAITWQGGLQPLLAESWDMEEDGKVWIFHLRKGVKWHDGEPFTADDVVFSFNAYANPEVASTWTSKASSIKGYKEFQAGEADGLSGVTAVDDHTVRVELTQAMPLWINLEQIYLVIVPKHILGDVPPKDLRAQEYWRNRVGTGPFKWEDYKEGQYISLVRNEEYFLGAPKLEKIIYHMYSDASTHVAALEGGEIDTIAYETTLVSVNDVERLDAVEGIDVVIMEKGSPTFITLNHNREWGDKRLRQALRYGIDVKTILETIYPGARPAYTMFPQSWATPDDLNPYEFDPEKAKKLLKEAGWSGREVDFIYHYGDELNQNLIIAIQQYLADIGVKLAPRKIDPAGIHALRQSGEWDTGYMAHGMGIDPATGEPAVRSTGGAETFGYSNKEVDALFEKGKALRTREERAPVYQQISRILNEDMPNIWLWYDIRPLAFNRRVVGPYEHWNEQKIIYFNLPVYNEIEKWYIK
jgi:peptide/nickel transport system substrate-binding protein